LNPKPKYSLEELITKCDASAPISPEVQEWLDAPAVGKELI
ncbi:antitoxin, partial [Shewanella sp. 11B5]